MSESATPIRVLLVEDNPGDARLIAEMLAEAAGSSFALRQARSLGAALESFGEPDVQAVLLDLGLPDSDGIATLAAIRPASHDVPIIVLTGNDDEELALSAVRAGAQDYLVKGRLTPDSLRRSLGYAIERHAILGKLHRSEQRYRTLTGSANDSISILTPGGVVVEANPRLAEVLGYPIDEIVGKHIRDLAAPGAEEANLETYQNAVDRGRAPGMRPIPLRKSDGGTVFMEFSTTTVDVGGETLVYSIGRDVTERVRLTAELEVSNRSVIELQKFEAIGRLAGGVAHDFNNVLGAISGWAQLALEETAEGSRVHGSLERIRPQAEGAAGLTRQLLAFARSQVLEPRLVDANAIISDAEGLLRKLVTEEIELKLALSPEPVAATADRTQVEQVLMNLVTNARDAMPDGGRIVIESSMIDITPEYTRLHTYARPGRYALLTVSDTGIGMAEETQSRIFEPFYTTKEAGHGLGLATVYGIVRQHDGFIHVYSEPGLGTTFRIYLPAAESVEEVRQPERAAADPGGSECILVAEDHLDMREMVTEILGRAGYNLLVASDGREAVRLFQSRSSEIALVILDVIMPELGGPDAYDAMCAQRPGLPVIFVSGYSTEIDRTRVLQRGFAFLQKPYDPRDLKSKVREVLQHAT